MCSPSTRPPPAPKPVPKQASSSKEYLLGVLITMVIRAAAVGERALVSRLKMMLIITGLTRMRRMRLRMKGNTLTIPLLGMAHSTTLQSSMELNLRERKGPDAGARDPA